MKYPLDELIDKRSIIQLKIERIGDNSEIPRLQKEYDDYGGAIKEYVEQKVCTPHQVTQWHKRLYEINGKIWDLEAEIRRGQLGKMSLEEVGRRAIAIRETNGLRVKIKSEIVEATDIGYKDVKVNHAAQKTTADYDLPA